MSREEAEALATRFNLYVKPKPKGFIQCSVLSHDPTILIYDFDSEINAHNFLFEGQLIAQIRREIDPSQTNRVKEYH